MSDAALLSDRLCISSAASFPILNSFFFLPLLFLFFFCSEIPASSNTSTVTVAELSNGSSKQKAH